MPVGGGIHAINRGIFKESLKNLPFSRDVVGCGHRPKETVPMPKQPAIPGLRDAMKKKVTARAVSGGDGCGGSAGGGCWR